MNIGYVLGYAFGCITGVWALFYLTDGGEVLVRLNWAGVPAAMTGMFAVLGFGYLCGWIVGEALERFK